MTSKTPIYLRMRAPFERWLSLPNYDVVEIVAATVLANRLPGEPLWLALVGPSSSGKTEVVRSCSGLRWVHSVGHFTKATFVSGFKTSEKDKRRYGLLQEMSDGKPHVILVNDFSSVLDKDWSERNTIMNQFRNLYDGEWDAPYGNDICISWKGKIGMIVCSTKTFDRVMAAQGAFGDRFLVCRNVPGEAFSVAEKASRNSSESKEMRKQLISGMKLIDKLKIPESEIELSLDAREFISQLTIFVCRARSVVPRDSRTKEIIDMPEIEGSARTSSQLSQLLRGLLVLRERKESTLEEMELIERVALGTIPSLRLKVMQHIDLENGSTLNALVKTSGIPRSVLHRVLEDLRILLLTEWKATQNSRSGKHLAVGQFSTFFFRTRRTDLQT